MNVSGVLCVPKDILYNTAVITSIDINAALIVHSPVGKFFVCFVLYMNWGEGRGWEVGMSGPNITLLRTNIK